MADGPNRGRRPGEEDGSSTIGMVVDSTVLLTEAERSFLSSTLEDRFAVVPLTVIIDDVEHVDGGLDPAHLCAVMRDGARVSTSMPTAEAFKETFTALTSAGAEHIIVLTLSAALSGTHGSAVNAAKDIPVPVTVLDTRSVSAASAGAALLIAQGARDGRGPAALCAAAEDYLRDETAVLFSPATLEHLQRGGRIGKAASLVGRALSIVPVLCIRDGVVDQTARVRTVRKAHARLLAEAFETAHRVGDCEVVVLLPEGSLDAAGDAARALWNQVEKKTRAEGWGSSVGVLSSVLTAHVGPGAVGIAVRGRG